MKTNDYLEKHEIKLLLVRNNWKGAFEIIHTWFFIVSALALAAYFQTFWSIFVALWILGGKQLACAIIMHDASHYSLFTSRKVNEWVGNYLGAYPILMITGKYRPYHLEHHVHTGQDDDPDLSLTKGYPASKPSLVRKFVRDLTGVTGLKTYAAILLMHVGYFKFTLNGRVERDETKYSFKQRASLIWSNLSGILTFHILFFLVLFFLGYWWLYLLWWAALLTTNQFCLRVRSIAEHSVVPDRLDMQKNTRTTYANFLERLLFAPHHVNYHAEHHLLMNVPCYNYPKMHKIIKERGFYDEGVLEHSYFSIIKLAIKTKD